MLLDGVSLGIEDGDRIGIVGRNGGGKTTLVSLMTGEEPPDSGRITRSTGVEIATLGQADLLPSGATIRQVVLGDREEHEWAGSARVRSVLEGLLGGLDAPGFPAGLDTVVGPLSGGERRRIALAALLVGDPQLLILDEPTNHLDVEAVDWLARHLLTRRFALVVVTHDRWFLDAVCSSTWEVEGGRVHSYEGGYSSYVLARAERDRVAAATEARRQNLLRKELAWLRRGPPARTSKPKFRIDAANALIADEPPPRDRTELLAFASARLGKSVYDVEDVTVSAGDRVLFRNLTWRLGPADRVGIVGVNGSGKTTLLRLLLGQLQPLAGTVTTGRTVRPAVLSQEVLELDPALRVLSAVEEVARVIEFGKGRQLTAGQLLERFGFTGNRQWTPVGDLSGGERRRLQLLRLLMTEPNVLLLDEPTNDLDIDTLTALEDLLDEWPGTLVAVSHDRYFLERVTDTTVALLGDGGLAELPGGVEEYLARRRSAGSGGAPRAAAGAVESGTPARPTPAGRTLAADPRAVRKELAKLERSVERLSRKEEQLHGKLAEVASDYETAARLDAELRGVLAEKTAAEDAWLELSDTLD
ncbi:MAG: ABC-F family ATP-binding cassette domain-containing protein [Actinomycetota bacterium]|nr:ABC-F family ATP-binding cassette domain-containing protein [Actinomycetota bacterium]